MSIDAVNGTQRTYDWHLGEKEDARAPEDPHIDTSAAGDQSGTTLLLCQGDLSAQVAALAIRTAQKQRETNRNLQVTEEAALERAEAEQVAALHDKADNIRMAGMIDGTSSAISGAFTIAGAFAETQGEKELYDGSAKRSDGLGKGLGGIYRGRQADDEADEKQHDHEAGHHRRNLDAARDGVREGQDLLERALDFYKQSQQGAGEAMNTSVRRA